MPAGIVACVGWLQSAVGTASLCDLPAKRVRLDEVGERALAVDLDHRQPLPVAGLQLAVAVDADLLEPEPELLAGGAYDALRGGAEVAALGVVEDDAGYG